MGWTQKLNKGTSRKMKCRSNLVPGYFLPKRKFDVLSIYQVLYGLSNSCLRIPESQPFFIFIISTRRLLCYQIEQIGFGKNVVPRSYINVTARIQNVKSKLNMIIVGNKLTTKTKVKWKPLKQRTSQLSHIKLENNRSVNP